MIFQRLILLLTVLIFICFSGAAHSGEPCLGCPISTIAKEVNLSYLLKWEQIPGTINAGQTENLSIVSNLSKFTWTVSGTGFWFNLQHTVRTIENISAKTITLYAAANACGTATVTVRGFTNDPSKNYSIVGRIKGSAGQWVQCFKLKGTICYANDCNQQKITEIDSHQVTITSCDYGSPSYAGTCEADGWQYTAHVNQFNIPDTCTEDPGIWALYIYYWSCNQ